MDSQTLERLLIDRSLGAMNEDVEQLLDHYLVLTRDAAAARDGRDWARTVEQVRSALRTAPSQAKLPPLKVPRVIAFPGRWRRTLATAAAVAASLLIGLLAGAWGFPRNARGAPHVAQSPAPAPVAQVRPVASDDLRDDRFWSAQRLYAQAGAVRKNAPVLWISPAHEPRRQ